MSRPWITEREGAGHDDRVPRFRSPQSVLAKVGASVAVVATATGLCAFATFGSFDDRHDPFPHSIRAPHRGTTSRPEE